jgi:predicted GNAT family N-acyltransferase
LTTKELYQLLKLRNEVFVVEQDCIYQDCDGKDIHSWHLLEKESGHIAAYLRILPKGISHEEVSIGRVVVDPAFRGKGLARKMLLRAIDFIRYELHENTVRISAQVYLKAFYESLGFEVVSDVYLEDGIEHVEMLYENNAVGLMIVDVQNAMFECDGGVYKGQEVLQNIRELLEDAREKEMPIIFVQHTDESGDYGKGSHTWEIHERLKPLASELIVEKNYWDAFQKTELENVLKGLGLRRLIIVGMQTEYCMDTTIRNAFSRGYQLMGVKGCHTTFDSSVLKAVDMIHHHESIWDGRFMTMLTQVEALAVISKKTMDFLYNPN